MTTNPEFIRREYDCLCKNYINARVSMHHATETGMSDDFTRAIECCDNTLQALQTFISKHAQYDLDTILATLQGEIDDTVNQIMEQWNSPVPPASPAPPPAPSCNHTSFCLCGF